MKNITKKLLSALLALAIIVTGIMIPSNVERVEAASNGKYWGYDTYEDYVEATGLNMGATKKSLNEISNVTSGYDVEKDTWTYYTYGELAKNAGFVIHANCDKILVDMGGTVYMGYKADGARVRIYRANGYDLFGYDSKYKTKSNNDKVDDKFDNIPEANGLEVDFLNMCYSDIKTDERAMMTVNKNTKLIHMINKGNSSKDPLKIRNVWYHGKKLSTKDYMVKVKTIAKNVDKAGIYTVTVTASEKYDNAKISVKVLVMPGWGFVLGQRDGSNNTFYAKDCYNNKTYDKYAPKGTYKIEYSIYKSTKTKKVKVDGKSVKAAVINTKNDKVVKKGTVTIKSGDKKKVYTPKKANKPGEYYYVKYRFSTKAGDETIYSDWYLLDDGSDAVIRENDKGFLNYSDVFADYNDGRL